MCLLKLSSVQNIVQSLTGKLRAGVLNAASVLCSPTDSSNAITGKLLGKRQMESLTLF